MTIPLSAAQLANLPKRQAAAPAAQSPSPDARRVELLSRIRDLQIEAHQLHARQRVDVGEGDRRGERLVSSQYGPDFDRAAATWATLEREHDKQHPERDQCGGIGRCSLMFAAHDLEVAMIDALIEWRKSVKP